MPGFSAVWEREQGPRHARWIAPTVGSIAGHRARTGRDPARIASSEQASGRPLWPARWNPAVAAQNDPVMGACPRRGHAHACMWASCRESNRDFRQRAAFPQFAGRPARIRTSPTNSGRQRIGDRERERSTADTHSRPSSRPIPLSAINGRGQGVFPGPAAPVPSGAGSSTGLLSRTRLATLPCPESPRFPSRRSRGHGDAVC